MKKSIFTLVAILLLITLSCKKESQNNRTTTSLTTVGTIIPKVDSTSLPNPRLENTTYQIRFRNYKEFEDVDVNENIIERGMIWSVYGDPLSGFMNNQIDTSAICSTTTPTVNYIPIARYIHITTGSSHMYLYFFRYYARLESGNVIVSQATSIYF